MSEPQKEEEKNLEKSSEEEQKQIQEAYELELIKKDLANPAEMNYKILVKLQKLIESLNSISQQLYDKNQILASKKGLEVEESNDKEGEQSEQPE